MMYIATETTDFCSHLQLVFECFKVCLSRQLEEFETNCQLPTFQRSFSAGWARGQVRGKKAARSAVVDLGR